MWDGTSKTEVQTNRKRGRVKAMDQTEGNPRCPNAAASDGKKQKVFTLPAWKDIPNWKTARSPLMDIPLEILDKIFGTQSGLTLQDHLAFSGTCRSIHRAYTDEVWKALELLRHYDPDAENCVAARHIFSAAWGQCPNPENADGKSPTSVDNRAEWSSVKAKIVKEVNEATVTTTNARFEYKITEKEILSLPFQSRPNPHNRNAQPMRLFRRAQVYALAMRVHGGPHGHQVYLRRLAEQDAKSKATRTRVTAFQS